MPIAHRRLDPRTLHQPRPHRPAVCAPALIRVAALTVSGTTASGTLRSDPGGFSGVLNTAGGGIDGRLLFAPVGDIQRIEMHLALLGANVALDTPVAVRRGRLDAVLLLDPPAPRWKRR
jgi:translocation and assembly module TamB